MLSSISASKVTGLDELPARLIKDGSSVIANPIIYNYWKYDDLEVARVVQKEK